MRKELVLLGALLMIGAVFPSAVAHWGDSSGFGDDNKPEPGVVTDGVAGRVVGVSGPAVVGSYGYVVAASPGPASCDLEVRGSSDGDVTTQETEVDEVATDAGQVPDNTFDDGGYGRACHVASYANEDFNTEGCGDTADHGEARASPAGVLPVFVGAVCDYGTSVTELDPTGAISTAICAVNTMFEGRPGGSLPCLDPLTNQRFRNCQLDGAPDDVNYGYATPNSGPPVPATGDCPSGTTSVLVFETVDHSRTSVSQPANAVWTT